jgi:hypothetical protein
MFAGFDVAARVKMNIGWMWWTRKCSVGENFQFFKARGQNAKRSGIPNLSLSVSCRCVCQQHRAQAQKPGRAGPSYHRGIQLQSDPMRARLQPHSTLLWSG